jgi:hypothetical protein
MNIKPNEKVNIGFELLKKDADLGLPIEDYLDSFQISWAMKEAIKDLNVSMGSSLSRNSQLDDPERISELRATLMGCELSKFSNEPIFQKICRTIKILKIDNLEIASAVFAIHGKGYSGRHYFGDCIGYLQNQEKPDGSLSRPDCIQARLLSTNCS